MIAPALLVNSVRILALLGALALMLSGECQVVFIVAFALFFGLGWLISKRGAIVPFIGKIQPLLALAALAIAVLDFFTLSKSFLLAVAHFLLMVQGLRLLALQTARENLGSVLLASLMVLSAATLSVDWSYFALFLIFILTVIWTLMLHTLMEESRRHASTTAAPLPLPRFVPYLRVSAVAGFAVALGCCAVVFALFPRLNFQGFHGQFLQPVRKTGFTSQVNLAGGGRISQDSSVVMRIELDPSDRSRWSGYLRGQSLEEFHDGVWRRPPGVAPVRVYRSYANQIDVSPRTRPRGRALHQRIFLESMETPLLFAMATPALLRMERPFADLFPDGAFQRVYGDTWRVRYDVDSYPSSLDPVVVEQTVKPARAVGPVSAAVTIEDLGKDLKRGSTSRLQTSQRFTEYLRAHYQYSLVDGPRAARGEDALDSFLFETKRGHCEYFASALCLLLRSQSIPARVVTGFLSREWNARGNYMVVRMRDAHTWVEAQMEDGAWIGLDASPREIVATPAGWLAGWSEAADYLNLRWNRYILSYDFEKQVEVVRAVTSTGGSLSNQLAGWKRWTFSFKFGGSSAVSADQRKSVTRELSVNWLQGVGAALLMIIGVIWWRRRAPSRVWFYRSLLRFMEKRAGRPLGSETLREFMSKNATAFQSRAEAVRFLVESYYALRFSAGAVDVDRRAIRAALVSLK